MKIPLIFTISMLFGIALVHFFSPKDEVIFCGNRASIPENFTLLSSAHLESDSFIIQWFHPKGDLLDSMAAKNLHHFMNSVECSDLGSLKLASFQVPLMTRQLRYRSPRHAWHRIIAHGIVNNQPVLITMDSMKQLKSASDFPMFIRDLLRLS